MKAILAEMRVKHYVKNALVFFPLIFSLNLLEAELFFGTLLVFAAFCFGASAVYIVNDIADVKRDRLHPHKKNRPIASGAISVRKGAILAVILFLLSLGLTIFAGGMSPYLLLLYLALNMLYSFILKHVALADVFCIMAGFLLRVAAGAVVIDVPISSWLMLTIMSLSLFMGFGKRRGELRHTTASTRKVLNFYTEGFLEKSTYSMMTLSAAFYALWAIDPGTAASLGTDNLIWTKPLVMAGLLRYAQLIEAGAHDGDPTNVLYSDIALLCIMLIYALSVVAIIYFA